MSRSPYSLDPPQTVFLKPNEATWHMIRNNYDQASVRRKMNTRSTREKIRRIGYQRGSVK